MASFAYKLLVDRYKTMEPFDWLQALIRGDLVLVDPNETGKNGPLLHALLALNDTPELQLAWSQDRADCFFPDKMAEKLAMHLITMGADPWIKDEHGRDAMDLAAAFGFPVLFESLMQHAGAPSLESILDRTARVSTRAGSGELPLVIVAAGRNQDEFLKVLCEANFDVNVVDCRGLSALAHAPTAQMVSQLSGLGADLSWRTGSQVQWIAPGLDLPSFWKQHSHFSGTDLVKLQSVWRKHASRQGLVQPEALAPVSQRLDALVSTITKFPYPAKAVVLEQVKQLGLKKPWTDESGAGLVDRLIQHFEASTSVAPVRGSVLEWVVAQDPQGEARHLEGLFRCALKTGSKGRLSDTFSGCVGRWTRDLASRRPEGLSACFDAASVAGMRTVEIIKPWLNNSKALADYAQHGFYSLDSSVALGLGPFVDAFSIKNTRGVAQGWTWFMGDMVRAGEEGDKSALWQTVLMLLPDEALVQGVGLLEAVHAQQVGAIRSSSNLTLDQVALHTTFWEPSLQKARALGAWGSHSAHTEEALEIYARRTSPQAVVEKRAEIIQASLGDSSSDSITAPAAPRF